MKTHDVRTARDPSDDYIYGDGTTPVEEVSLVASTPTYMTYTTSDSTWLTTNSAGDETGFWGYDAFGNLAFGTPTPPFGYAGQFTDPSTGFSDMRARWYAPQTGGFTTRDPAFPSTDTAYTYAGDDPVNRTDPTGKCGVNTCGSVNEVNASTADSPCPQSEQSPPVSTDADGHVRNPDIQFEPEITAVVSDFGELYFAPPAAIGHACTSGGKSYGGSPGPFSACLWVADNIVDLMHTGISDSGKLAIGVEYICSVIWNHQAISDCASGLWYGDVSSGSMANDFDGSPFDNSLNWLFDKADAEQNAFPAWFDCLTGTFGPDVLGYPSLADVGQALGTDVMKKLIDVYEKVQAVREVAGCVA
jgi:RHS repeat-associated protein